MLSAPPLPSSLLAPALPTRTLPPTLPVALRLAVPRRVSRSRLAARTRLTLTLHRVDAGAGGLGDEVGRGIDDVGVVAEAAGHLVGAEAAVEEVVAVVAEQLVEAGAAARRIVAAAGADGVVAEAADEGVMIHGPAAAGVDDGSGGGGSRAPMALP